MKKLYWLFACTFIILIIGAIIMYNIFSEKYTPENLNSTTLSAAPDFTVVDANGNSVSLSDFHGKPVVINFWATWCSPCKSELPAFDAMYKKYGNQAEFMMVNLTDGFRETEDGVKAFLADAGYSFPVFYDTASVAANTYRISSVPMTFFITSDGMKKASYMGPMREGILENYIKKILGGN